MMNLPDSRQLGRYRDIARLLLRYGRGSWARSTQLTELLDGDTTPSSDAERSPDRLAEDLEQLGPTFVKIGQLLSTRPDLLPAPYRDALARLQDDLDPFPYELVEELVERELGVRISKAFDEFEREPYAAASVAQVHRARMRDGRRVVVKVQRPKIREEVARDLEALRTIAHWLNEHSASARRYDLESIAQEFERALVRELDFRREAAHLDRLRASLEEYPRVVVPRPIHDYTTGRVLTMSYVDGNKIGELSPVVRIDVPGPELADELFRAYLHQVLVDGMFHADPHPGNVFLTRDHEIALIDLGMVGFVPSGQQEQLLQLLLALSDRDGDRTADVALCLARRMEDHDEEAFRRRIADLVVTRGYDDLQNLQPGQLLMEVCGVAAEHGIRMPSNLSLLAKTMLNLDQIALALDPEFDPAVAIRGASNDLVAKRVGQKATTSSVFSALLDAKELAEKLPDRMNKILETLATNRLRVKVNALDEDRFIRSLEKVANRITAGLVLAALIVGAAMLTRVETDSTLFGYPALAIVFFLLAAVGGLKLVWDALRSDV